MEGTFADVVLAATIAVAVALVARSRGWGIALPLIAVGAFVDWLPVGPDAPPDPEFVLVVILAPLVFGEALGSSYLDLRRVRKPVLALAVGLVVATTFAVGAVAATLTAVPIALACALGAVLAPTDAVAVSTVARRAGLPRRLVSILEGESLVNDGTGLTALTVALAAAAAGSVTVLEVSGIFLVAVAVGVGVGALGGWLLAVIVRLSSDLIAANALVLIAPFLLYAVAERLDGSGILALVVAALVIAHTQNADPGHTGRLQSGTVWRQVTFVLQAIAFFFVGLELPEVLRRLDDDQVRAVLILVPAVLVTLVATRALFVLGMVGWRSKADGVDRRGLLRGGAVLAWAGARGPVSGLAAFSIPIAFTTGETVPYRDVILATTFCIIVITLLLSLTLGPVARAVGLHPDDDTELIRRIDAQLARAALDRLADIESEAIDAGAPLSAALVERVQADVERRVRSGEAPSDTTESEQLQVQQGLGVARAMVRAEQEELLRLRDEEGLPDSIVRPLLRTLDLRAQALQARRP